MRLLALALVPACDTDDDAPRRPFPVPVPVPAPAPDPDPSEPVGLLVVTLDTTRRDRIGPLMPAIEAFAASGRRYPNARAHAPWTKPSVATMFTSAMPAEHGVLDWEDQLDPARPTLATALHDAGFTTEAVVAHNAFDPATNEFEVGFDRFELSYQTDQWDLLPGEIETSEHLTDLAIPRLRGLLDAGEPFYLWVHYFDPHNDFLDHPSLHYGTTAEDRYDEEVTWTDTHVGRLLAIADTEPRLIVAVVADHGEEWGDHGDTGHAHTLYDELLRVPFALRGPGIRNGSDPAPVGLLDLAPTLLQLLEVPPPDSFRGVSLLPEAQVRPLWFDTRRLVEGDLRGGLVEGFKVVADLQAGHVEIYDVEEDPRERHDLAGAAEMREPLLEVLRAEFPEVPADLPARR